MESKEQNISAKAGKIKYKAEPVRHFPRYKIPAYIEIEGKRYRLRDWSVSGCAVSNLPDGHINREWNIVNIIIPFDVFDAVIKDVKVTFLKQHGDGAIGCKFCELKPEQVSLLQDIVESYLEGSIVSLDGFINTIKREDLRESLEKARPKPPQKNGVEEILRKFFIFSLLFLVTFSLLAFLVYALHTRVFLIKATSAFVDSNMEIIKTPASGIFKMEKNISDNKSIKNMEILGVLRTMVGIPVVIRAPYNGKIVKIFVHSQGPVREGDPLFEILPSKYQLFVVANILHKDLERLRISQTARIILPDGKILKGSIEKIISPIHEFMMNQTQSISLSSVSYDRVIVKLPGLKNAGLIGSSVSVTFDLTPEFIKRLIDAF